MKKESEVSRQLNEILSSEVKRRFQVATERLPHRCSHNYRHPLDARKRLNGEVNESYNRVSMPNGLPVLQSVGLCMLGAENPEEWAGTICDEPIDAKRCPYFSPTSTETSIKEELLSQMQDLDWVKQNLPDAYQLLWVLEKVSVPRLPWWKRLLLRLTKPQPELLAPQFDATKLLTSGE